ncbi:MAG: hypothetical protein NC252_12640, partial [Roseburia sp.]|nr:hypothetical protein [Roseburia sp.]
MKHKLLLFGASMLASAGAMAQWTQPVPATFEELKASEGNDTIVYYLYNVGTKSFFTEGNDYGTRSSVGKEGLKVFFSKYVPSEEEEENPAWDGKTYVFNDYSIKKNKWMQVFIDSEEASYVDRASQPNYFWEIEADADNTYRFYGAELNPTYNWLGEFNGAYFGVDRSVDEKITYVSPLLFKAEEPEFGLFNLNWKFVSEETYATYKAQLDVYDAALSLEATIEEAQEKGVDVSAAEAVYADTNSTKEQLEAAQADLKRAIVVAIENSASPENPTDMTAEYVGNSTFEENSNGWLTTTGAKNTGLATNKTDEDAANGGNNFTGKFWENWNASAYKGKMYKVIHNVPNGLYSLQMGAFSDDGASKAFVYANNDSVVVPSSAPATYKVWTIVDADSIEIGLKKIEVKGLWLGIDNVVLTYYGNSLDSYKHYIANIATPAEDYESEDIYLQKEVLDAYKAVLEQAQNCSTKEEVLAMAATVKEANGNIQANVNAYNAYAAAVEEAAQYFAEHGDLMGDDVDFVTWYLDSYDEPDADYPNGGAHYILENCTLSTEEVLAETARLAEWKATAIKNGISKGSDLTNLIINPGFELADGEGWIGADKITNPHGGSAANYCAEAFNQTFDVYQDVDGLPVGLYKVSVQAFYRAAANDIAWAGRESDPVLSEVYFNDFATPVKNVMSIQYDENLADNCWTTPDGTYTLDGMNSASAAFSLEDETMNFTQNVYGLVTDGKMRIGIRQNANPAAQENRWTLWDNFKITYMGKDETALADVIGSLTETAQELLNEEMFAADKDALSAAIGVATDAQGADAMYDALIELNAGINAAKASVLAYVSLNDAIDNLAETMGVYENSASAEALSEAENLLDEVSKNLENYTVADAEGKVAEINDIIGKLRVPDGSEASDESPIDFTQVIENPAFDEGNANGWDYSSFTQGNKGYQSNSVYTNAETEASCNQFIEAWRNGTALEDAEIVQTLAYLPAGGYSLEVDAIACEQSNADAETEGVFLFAQEDGKDWYAVNLNSGNGTPEHALLYFTKQEADSKLV